MPRVSGLAIRELLPCAVRSADANGPALNIRDLEGELALTLMSAAASTDDELDITIEHSVDGSTGWSAVSGAAFPTVDDAADATETIYVDSNALRQFIRAVVDVTGTTVSVACGVVLVGQAKYS